MKWITQGGLSSHSMFTSRKSQRELSKGHLAILCKQQWWLLLLSFLLVGCLVCSMCLHIFIDFWKPTTQCQPKYGRDIIFNNNRHKWSPQMSCWLPPLHLDQWMWSAWYWNYCGCGTISTYSTSTKARLAIMWQHQWFIASGSGVFSWGFCWCNYGMDHHRWPSKS